MANSISSFQFTLDGNGNRVHSTESQPTNATALNGVSALYTYNTQKDRLLSAGTLGYTYDNEGQLLNAGGTGLTFDYNHRLVAIGSDTQFSYDGRGNRLSATKAGVATHYIYDPWGNLLAEADGSNNITRKYVYGDGLLAMATSSARYCYHFNGTGSTVAMTDITGAVVNSYAYGPFGQILAQQEAITQPFKYVGQYGVMAEPNGLYYMRARYYDPGVGRFISEDPLGFGGGDVNLYAYVQNDPVNWIGPFGLSKWHPVPGQPGWEVRRDKPHCPGDCYHEHYKKRGKKVGRKVNCETGEQKPHGEGSNENIPKDVVDAAKKGFELTGDIGFDLGLLEGLETTVDVLNEVGGYLPDLPPVGVPGYCGAGALELLLAP